MRLSTKILLCLVGVLGNAGIWGDASIGTLLAQTYGYTNKLVDSKNCSGPCKFGQKPRTCSFEFRVEPARIGNRTVLAINGRVPGPPVEVCANDVVVVDVVNRLPGQELALHWRGLAQKGSPYMDGVPMVTQCPIASGTSFKYVFRAEEVGTYLYHAHSVSQQLHGVFGALIVRQPSPLEPASRLFKHDRGASHVLVVSADATSAPSTLRAYPTRLEVDGHSGDEHFRRISVTEGQKYRIRMINAIPLDCPIIVTAARHELTIIASDGRAVKPTMASSFVLLPGERIDFVLNANQKPSTYELKIEGDAVCKDLLQRAFISYEGAAEDLQVVEIDKKTKNKEKLIYGQSLFSAAGPPADLTVSPIGEKRVYLKVDTNSIRINDNDNDYRYLSDAMPVPPFYPSELSNDMTQVVQINGKSFMYPNAPILSQPKDILPHTICPVGEEYRSKGVECVHMLDVDYKSTLELVIVDEGFGSESKKTFHMHGKPMYVLATSKSHTKGLSKEDVEEMDVAGKIERNLWNPPQKDTIYVPNKGYTIVRVIADNPGTWLFECRECGVSSLPTAIIIRVKSKLPSKILNNLPKCGNYKPPDVLIN